MKRTVKTRTDLDTGRSRNVSRAGRWHRTPSEDQKPVA
jgi:hypothetical protein